MPKYSRSPKFKESYNSLPAEIKEKAKKAFKLFKINPRHPSLVTKPIKGLPEGVKIFEGRIDEYWRFTFEIKGDTYYFRNIGRHDITSFNP